LVRKTYKECENRLFAKIKKTPETMSIEELFESEEPIGDKDIVIPSQKMTFDFEEERLAKAFYELPLMKRKILEMLFVEEIKPEEIAKKLNCSSQYVYNQKFRAIKTLREQLCKGENTDE
jgi:RNA polymerase sigma factor (sigma-70 family)